MRTERKSFVLAGLVALFGLLAGSPILAGNYIVFVHGKGENSSGLADTNAGRWGNTDTYGAASKMRNTWTKRFVNYNGTQNPTTSGTDRAQTKLTAAINSYCKNGNQCYIVCHSAGCMAVGYWIANNVAPSTLLTVVAGGSAASGSPFADIGTTAALLNPFLLFMGWAVAGEPNSMTISLRQGTARGSYNHNSTDGKTIRMVAGYNGNVATSGLIGGEDDGLINFAGGCGYSSTGNMTHCNDGNNAKYTNNVSYCNSTGVLTCNTSKQGYNGNHSRMQNVARDAVDRLLGFL